ncbi:unnamed protein product [Peniophora sp. CBMAI 1063]|nr:unnamed protein product [Peniophora sp. CBMAI 1063]
MSGSNDPLKALENEWSSVARRQGAESVVLVNDVDNELPSVPPDFIWTEADYIIAPGYEPNARYQLHCRDCSPCGIGDPCRCIREADRDFDGAYDCGYLRESLVDCGHGFVIRECNPVYCRRCLNRASQDQRRWIPEIFKTDDGRGWGVRARVKLERGEILGVYTGKLLPPIDSATSGLIEASIQEDSACTIKSLDGDIDVQYMFALDGYSDRDAETAWSVDGYGAGNWTRFVNHSCKPNTLVYSRSLGQMTSDDQELLYLVLVARYDIPTGTELTFDYRPGGIHEAGQEGRQECLCGAMNCRGRLWT